MKRLIILLFLISQCVSTPAFAKDKVPILLYHSIEEYPGHGLKGLYVTPENFEKQMSYLKENGYTLLTFERWEDRKNVKKPVFITFDDAYKNNLNAFAVFKKLKDDHFSPTATIFAISDFVGRPNRLTANELKGLSDSTFFSIQSHTATHPDLKKTPNLEYELKNSKEKIENMTGKPVIALSYPFGKFDSRVVDVTKKYYRMGLKDSAANCAAGETNNMFTLPRIYIFYSTTLEEFKALLN